MAKTAVVTIERAAPEVAKIRDDVFVVPSRSNPGTLHVVKIVRGKAVCGCDGSYYAGKCYHQQEVQERIDADRRAVGLRLLTGCG